MDEAQPRPPRDQWIVGEALTADGRARDYIVHLAFPRFVARIIVLNDDGSASPEDEPVDLVSGAFYPLDSDTALCEVVWIDEPLSEDVSLLMNTAGLAIQTIEERNTLDHAP